jgi:non-heme chloroperoxidase
MSATERSLSRGGGSTRTGAPIAAHDIKGAGGLRLHVREWGNLQGPPILLVHGWSQSQLCWTRQLASPLAEEFHIVTFDNRGHGMSEKPLAAEPYVDAQLWADDVAAVIDRTGLDRPVLVAWSYGGFIVADYVRAYGGQGIAGINLVGAAVMLTPTFEHIGPGLLENAEDACAPDLSRNIAAIRRFLEACTAQPLSQDDRIAALCWNMVVPTEVRAALFAREIDAGDVLADISVPVLVTHGRLDRIVLPSMAEHVLAVCKTAEPAWYEGVGHMPFFEDPVRFNRELGDFVRRMNRAVAAIPQP